MARQATGGGRRAPVAVLALAGALAGCAALLNVDDVGYAGAGGDGGGDSDGDGDGSGGDGASTDNATGGDARTPDGGPCVPQPENCLDGIDNDCNGLIDCQDNACSGYACADRVPDGWLPAALAPTLDAGCGAGFSAGGPFNESPTSPLSCTCGCTSTANDCGGWLVASNSNNCTNPAAPSPGGPIFMQTSAGCSNRFMSIAVNTYMRILDASALNDTCSSITTPKAQTVTFTGNGTACLATAAGAGCQPSQPSCVPVSAGPFSRCIGRAGDVACPASGTWSRHVVGARAPDGGSAVSSDAGCSTCACAPTSTCTGAQTVLNGGLCSGPTPEESVSENCLIPGSAPSADSYVFTATLNATCAAGSSNVTGSTAFDTPATICCPR